MGNGTRKLASILGLIASVIVGLGALITALVYRGSEGERFSVLNHYISELGEVGVSQLAPFFNVCLIAGGLIMVAFMVALALYIRTGLGYFAAAVGVYCGLSCCLVGAFPMNNLARHVPVAFSFFYSALATLALFTIVTLTDRQKKLPKWSAAFGLLGVLCAAGFLAVPRASGVPHADVLNSHIIDRPPVSTITVLEWSVLLSLMLWVVLLCIDLLLRRNGEPALE